MTYFKLTGTLLSHHVLPASGVRFLNIEVDGHVLAVVELSPTQPPPTKGARITVTGTLRQPSMYVDANGKPRPKCPFIATEVTCVG